MLALALAAESRHIAPLLVAELDLESTLGDLNAPAPWSIALVLGTARALGH